MLSWLLLPLCKINLYFSCTQLLLLCRHFEKACTMSLTYTHTPSSSDCSCVWIVSRFWNLENIHFLILSLIIDCEFAAVLFSQEMQCHFLTARFISDTPVSWGIFGCSPNPSGPKGKMLRNLHPSLSPDT